MRASVLISLFWFLFLGGVGAFFPFYSLYLRENLGLSGTQAGTIAVLPPLLGLLAQPFFGQLADRSGRRARVLGWLCFGSALGGLAMALPHSYVGMLLAAAVMSPFIASTGPLAMSISLAALADRGIERFGRLRVWGSVGFLLTAVGAPLVLDWLQQARGWRPVPGGPSEPGLEIAFVGFGVLVAAAGVAALCIPGGRALSLRAHKGEWRSLVGNGPYLRVLLVCLVAFSLMESPMFQFPVFVRAHGGDMGTVSRMWILMTLVEIPLFLISGAGLRRFGPRGLLAIGIAAAGVRWTLCGFTDDLRLIYAAQLLHGVTVAGFLGSSFYIDGVVSERLRSTGQTLVATLGVSVGGIVSNLGGGWLADHVSADAPYQIGGTGALLLAALLPFLLPRTPLRSLGAAPAESRDVVAAVRVAALSPEA